MSAIKIISANERLAEKHGVKILLVGPPGMGKTSQLRTLPNLDRVLFAESEAGDLAVRDLKVPMIRIEDWQTARDLACRIGGPNPSFPPTACYSQAHFEAAGGWLPGLDMIDTFFIDSFTQFSRLALRYAEMSPEAFSERTGKKDLRSIYGLLARELLLWVSQIQHTTALNIILVAVLEFTIDELNRGFWALQCEGAKTGRELPGIVDEIITYQFLDFNDGKPPERGFVCTSPNPWNYPAKDRSGRLALIEPPDLGRLLDKLIGKTQKEG